MFPRTSAPFLMLVLIPQAYSYTNVNDKTELTGECYQCTTHREALQSWHEGKDIPVDSACGDPLVEGSRAGVEPKVKKYLKKCPDSSTFCDKTYQNVDGEIRIVRSCQERRIEEGRGSAGCRWVDPSKSGQAQVQYCECTGDACNGAPTRGSTPLTATLVTAMLAVMLK